MGGGTYYCQYKHKPLRHNFCVFLASPSPLPSFAYHSNKPAPLAANLYINLMVYDRLVSVVCAFKVKQRTC